MSAVPARQSHRVDFRDLLKRLIVGASAPRAGEAEPLSKVERKGILSLVGLAVLVYCVSAFFNLEFGLDIPFYEVTLTLLFLAFVWIPRVAPAIFISALAISFLVGSPGITLFVYAIAIAGIIRTGTPRGIAVSLGVFMIGIASYVAMYPEKMNPENIFALMFVATTFGGIGFVLRGQWRRVRELRETLRERVRTEKEAVRLERLRIADELHDYVAHDLTIIGMHLRVMDRIHDQQAQQDSLHAIGEATQRALADLRRMVDQTEFAEGPGANVEADIQTTLMEGVRELESAGLEVSLDCPDFDGEQIPRVIRGTLTRIFREGATNILKHGAGPVHITFVVDEDQVRLTMKNREPVARPPKSPFLSGGFGTVRMQERARSLNGDFVAKSCNGFWLMDVRFPVG